MHSTAPRRVSKLAALGAFLLLTPVILTGCAAPKTSTQVTAKPAVSKEVTRPEATVTGDAVAAGMKITDELGTYETVKVNPDAAALTLSTDMVSKASLVESGFTMAQVADAQRWLTTFIAGEGLDSIALDRDKVGWQEWQATKAPTYLDPAFTDGILGTIKPIDDRAQVILNDDNNAYLALVRDGGPRVKSEEIHVSRVSPGVLDDKARTPYVLISGNANAIYRTSDALILKSMLASGSGLKQDQLEREYPKLANKVDGDVQVQNTIMYQYALTLVDDKWRIATINNRTSFGYVGLTD